MDEPYRRFTFPEERAFSIAGNASGTLTALLALETHEQEAQQWKAQFSELLGAGQPDDKELADSKSMKRAMFDRIAALRRDVADLAADADSYEPPPTEGERSIITAQSTPPPPMLSTSSPQAALRGFEEWYAKGLTAYLRKAAQTASRLVDHLNGVEDPETTRLRDALQELVTAVRGTK